MLFSKFAAFYGNIWRSQFKFENFLEYTKEVWAEGLKEFDAEVICQSIAICRKQYEMPPTLPQMIQLCVDTNRRMRFEDNYRNSKKETRSQESAIAREHILRCKEILKQA